MNVRKDIKSVMKSIREDLENATKEGQEVVGYGLVIISHNFNTDTTSINRVTTVSPVMAPDSASEIRDLIYKSYAEPRTQP